MSPIKLDVESIEVTTFTTVEGPDMLLYAGQQAAQPACSDCFSTCNLLFSIYGC